MCPLQHLSGLRFQARPFPFRQSKKHFVFIEVTDDKCWIAPLDDVRLDPLLV